jgi:hypothetical protein
VQFSAYEEVPRLDDVIPRVRDNKLRVMLLHAQVGRSALHKFEGHVSYIACGDCHRPTTIIKNFAYYSGSPSFRDLSSVDPGPRSFVDVQLFAGSAPQVELVPIDTPLSTAIMVRDGRVMKVLPTEPEAAGPLDSALFALTRKYAYIKVALSGSDVALLEQAARALPGDWTVLKWSDKTVLMTHDYLPRHCDRGSSSRD